MYIYISIQLKVRSLHEELSQAYRDRQTMADELQLAADKQKVLIHTLFYTHPYIYIHTYMFMHVYS